MTSRTECIDTGTPDLLALRSERVLVLTMNRPQSRNALSIEMLEAIEQQLAVAESDRSIGCIVLTGAERGFCAGGDIKAMTGAGEHQISATFIQRQQHLQRATSGKLFAMPKPTLAVINGPAAGAGLSLAMACDLRTMSSETFLITAFAKLGLSGDFGGTYFVSQLVGSAKARELFYFSERVSADEALRLGLTNRLFKPAELMEESLALAKKLASGPGLALGFMKENLNRALTASADECLDVEATLHISCAATQDHREAATAFLEKRVPIFEGC